MESAPKSTGVSTDFPNSDDHHDACGNVNVTGTGSSGTSKLFCFDNHNHDNHTHGHTDSKVDNPTTNASAPSNPSNDVADRNRVNSLNIPSSIRNYGSLSTDSGRTNEHSNVDACLHDSGQTISSSTNDVSNNITPTTTVRTPTSRHRHRQGSGYVEFFGGTMACPTCRGSGRISRESENELVALIPVRDKRLQPRRTTLYVVFAVILCTLIGGILLFFLLPRSVHMTSNMPHIVPLNITFNSTFLNMRVVNEFNFTNTNFVDVTVSLLSVTAFFDQHIVGQFSNTSSLHIPLRSTRRHYIIMNLTFDGEEEYISSYCNDRRTYGHSLLIPFTATATSHYLGHEEEATLITYQHVRCTKEVLYLSR